MKTIDPTLQALIDADAFFADNTKWTKGTFASGRAKEPKKACVLGALGLVTLGYAGMPCNNNRSAKSKAFRSAEKILSKVVGNRPIPDWNDVEKRTFDDVKAAFKRAISMRIQQLNAAQVYQDEECPNTTIPTALSSSTKTTGSTTKARTGPAKSTSMVSGTASRAGTPMMADS